MNIGDIIYVIFHDKYDYSLYVINSIIDIFDYHGNHFYKITISNSLLEKITFITKTFTTLTSDSRTYVFDINEVQSTIKKLIDTDIKKCEESLKRCKDEEESLLNRILFLKNK